MILLRLRRKTPIANLVSGEIVTVKGVVSSQRPLTIPPSGTICVYYAMLRERFGKGERGRGRPLWFADSLESKCSGFTVSDSTGAVAVRVSGERLTATGTHHESGNIKGKRNKRYSADFFRPGDTVIVSGHVTPSEQGPGLVLCAPPNRDLKILVTRRTS